jgi:hypothetical protein
MTRQGSNGGGRGTEARRDNDEEAKVQEEESTTSDVRVTVLELQSSIVFGFASVLLVPYSSFVRALASCLLILHVVPEMCIDFSESLPPRAAAHGRYLATADRTGESGAAGCPQPRRRRRRWNQAQSLVFAAASLAQGLAYGFLLQINRQEWALDAYLDLVLAAAALWMASGLLVVASWVAAATTRTAPRRPEENGRFCCCCCRTTLGCGGLVLAGNVLYLLGCVCWLPAAINQRRNYNEAFLGGYLQRLAAGLWATAALLFLASDGGRLCCQRRDRTKRRRFGPSAAALNDRGRWRGEQQAGGAREDPVQETSSSSEDDGA